MSPPLLASPDQVLAYLKQLRSFPLPRIVAVTCPSQGKTNIIYRIELATSETTEDHPASLSSSIILKHTTPYAVNWPDLPLDLNRRVCEAHALREVPSTKLRNIEVRVPTLLFEDDAASVLLMEDICPPSAAKSSVTSLLSSYLEGDAALGAVGREEWCVGLGEALGNWLYALHQFGAGPNEARLRSLFEPNAESRSLDAFWSFGGVLERLLSLKAAIALPEQESLGKLLKKKEAELKEKRETLVMGDFRSANIFITSDHSVNDRVQAPIIMNVYDWEFSAYGAAYTDLGHFITESWAQDRIFARTSQQRSASCLIASSLLKKYQQMGGIIDLKDLLPYAATHMVSGIEQNLHEWSDKEKDMITYEALEVLRTIEDGDLARLEDSAFFHSLLH